MASFALTLTANYFLQQSALCSPATVTEQAAAAARQRKECIVKVKGGGGEGRGGGEKWCVRRNCHMVLAGE